ncbi:MAG: SAM-dependent methyltransferase [Deltaproteobacteria bacterium]|nr:SAM-dependent methyltransferase [Deltaproteobacteria bacterium]
MNRLPSSFRDDAGFLFTEGDTLYRAVSPAGRDDFDLFVSSGLYEKLSGERKIVSHREVTPHSASPNVYKILVPQKIPFISYPSEWCYSQLRDSALLTLDIQEEALHRGLSLKDASFFNVQFVGPRPIFIDTLSFEKRVDAPWVAYRQFCQHFLNPLVLMSSVSADMGRYLACHLDGVPSSLTLKMLPKLSRLKMGIFLHVWMHSASQKKHEVAAPLASAGPLQKAGAVPAGRQGQAPAKWSGRNFKLTGSFNLKKQLALVDSLKSTIQSLKGPKRQSEWIDYSGSAVHYSDRAGLAKKEFLDRVLDEPRPKNVWDLGGNIGEFARLATKRGIGTVCWDRDPACVEENYKVSRERGDEKMLPLVVDLANPTPAIGWAHQERMSFLERGPADLVTALALFHHLRITANIPVEQIADFMARLALRLVIEYVPKEDPMAKRLIAGRRDIFHDYTLDRFEAAFGENFRLVKKEVLPDTDRHLHLFERKK